ncbi:hypothetical protein BC567DRAFT_212814 [Phyllosticta citribraziliensis]
MRWRFLALALAEAQWGGRAHVRRGKMRSGADMRLSREGREAAGTEIDGQTAKKGPARKHKSSLVVWRSCSYSRVMRFRVRQGRRGLGLGSLDVAKLARAADRIGLDWIAESGESRAEHEHEGER